MKKLDIQRTFYDYGHSQKKTESYLLNGRLYRTDGPAFRKWFSDGRIELEEFYLHDKLCREDGPAWQRWYSNGKKEGEAYFIDGLLNREDGPAYILWDYDGDNIRTEYWINGRHILPEWFIQFGKDIEKDFSDEIVRNMILNIQGLVQ